MQNGVDGSLPLATDKQLVLKSINDLAIGLSKSCEILMFVCLQKEAKQCCDAKLDRAHCAGQRQ